MVNIYKDKKQSFLIYVMIISLVFAVIFAFFISNYYERKDEYYQNSINELNSEMDSIFYSYGLFSNYIYENYIETDYILNIVDTAYEADEATQDALRTELYDYLIGEYEHVVEYDFRQIHFHFPDSTSFLRMHSPDKYGDDLSDARYSVNFVNEHNISVSGFEEGKILNGYRFVYPLEHNGEQIGSVEVSVALTSVINVLTELTNNDYYFIIAKDVVYEKVYDEFLTNYEEIAFSEDFLVDLGTVIDCENRNLIEPCNLDDFLGEFDSKDLELLDEYKEFGFSTSFEGEDFEVVFTPISNIEEDYVAYFISISASNGAYDLYQQSVFVGLLILLLFIGALSLSWILISNRNLLQTISFSDGLTKINNRRKFEIDLKTELSRIKRYPNNLSFIMFDIDHFKKINDTYGHKMGDFVLEELSVLIKDNIREIDCFARYGGEEFIIMLLNSNLAGATKKAEELRELVENFKFGDIEQVTISLGVYEFKKDDTYENITEFVDKAMYKAKDLGRNKVFSSDE